MVRPLFSLLGGTGPYHHHAGHRYLPPFGDCKWPGAWARNIEAELDALGCDAAARNKFLLGGSVASWSGDSSTRAVGLPVPFLDDPKNDPKKPGSALCVLFLLLLLLLLRVSSCLSPLLLPRILRGACSTLFSGCGRAHCKLVDRVPGC